MNSNPVKQIIVIKDNDSKKQKNCSLVIVMGEAAEVLNTDI